MISEFDRQWMADERSLMQPLGWRKTFRTRIVGDLFHESTPVEWIDRMFAVMALCPQHTFQVLTKRAERMRKYFAHPQLFARLVEAVRARANWDDPKQKTDAFLFCGNLEFGHGNRWPLPSVWLGVSCERQQEADERIPHLMATPAVVHFISAEPLLGPLTISYLEWAKLNWVIVGGESGPNARPMHPDWARSLQKQCEAVDVPFFFKQWGEWKPGDGDTPYGQQHYRVGKKAAGRLLDGKEHNAMPSVLPSALAAPQNKPAQVHPASAEATAGKP